MANILIVEDDPVMLRMYTRVFQYEGLEVITADDGVKALETVKTIKPDIILLDIMMPQMSGLQVLDALKADLTTKSIPVIVFTNLAGKQDLDNVITKGAVGALNKTDMTPKQIVTMVKQELAKRQ
jgi:CheY-like chemotaxis protein